MDKEYATAILNGCDFFQDISINILIEGSLVIIYEKNKLLT
jgi:hypothetical protein